MDRLEAMAILLRVAERASFSAASRELGMPLATVSRKVGDLEAHLGTRLLTRTTRKVTLTDVGAIYVASARPILEQIEEAERAAAGEFQEPRGELVVTAPVLFGRLHVLPMIGAFLEAYPEINIRLVLADRNLHLIEDHVDMAVRIGPMPDSGMMAVRVGSMRIVTCASPDLLGVHGEPRAPQDLAHFPSVNFDLLSPGAVWPFRLRDKSGIEIPIRPRLSVSTAEAAVWAAIHGLGVTRALHYQCAEAVHGGALRIILAPFEVAPLAVQVLHAGRGAMPSKVRVFMDFAVSKLKTELSTLT